MKTSFWLAGAAALLFSSTAFAGDTIKIGFVSTFSGPTAVIGNDMRNSFELALDHLGRKMNGKPVEVIYEDDQQKPDVGKQKTEKLVQSDKVDFIVGYIWSNVLLASLKTAVDSQTFLISANAGPSQLAGELSGGWKQRLALGACTLPNPQLLLLDEPTAGVDPKARRDFWNEIHALAGEGLTVLVSTHYMDEAERCHEIAYIAYGHLLAHGTVPEVIAQSALATYTVSGNDLRDLAADLAGKPGIDMVAPFGTSLHVSGRDHSALEASIAPWREKPGLHWQSAAPSLEDVFIDLMNRSRDNFR
ncbi:MAG: ABC transporter substrate-binding protein [Bradyrhizobium sp.]|nr:ABC transporter substrate-binding protein [Bradyrhizobium sp.]